MRLGLIGVRIFRKIWKADRLVDTLISQTSERQTPENLISKKAENQTGI